MISSKLKKVNKLWFSPMVQFAVAQLAVGHVQQFSFHLAWCCCNRQKSCCNEDRFSYMWIWRCSSRYKTYSGLFPCSSYRRSRECAYIFSDCAYVIETDINRKCVRRHLELSESLVSLEDELTEMNIDVFLAWIPAHSGIQYNDMVDSIAKDTAH